MADKAWEVIACQNILVKSHREIYVHFLVTPDQEVDLGDAVYWNVTYQAGGAAHV